MSQGTHADAYRALARALSGMPALNARLLLEHPADGYCTGCTMPGSQNWTSAPCSIRTLAEMAQDIRLGVS